MKHMKRVLTFGMAMALSLSLAVPAFAADDNGDGYDDTSGEYIGAQEITGDPDTDLEEGIQGTYEIDTGKTVPFIGVIKPTQIKATIPTQVVFDLDPTLDVLNDWTAIETSGKKDINYAQVTNPSNLKILNNSTVPMYAYVETVTAVNAQLTNAQASLGTPKNVMFAITSTPEGTVDSITDGDHWMVPGAENKVRIGMGSNKHYLLNPKNGSGDGVNTSLYSGVAPVSADGTAGELQLWVNAISTTGWNSDDVFTVMPTIIVAAKDPDVTPVYTANTVSPGVNPDVETNTRAVKFSAPAGDVKASTTITLSTGTAGAEIYYTTDGNAPTISSTKYTSAISVGTAGTTTTIKAIAVKAGMNNSPVVTATYTAKNQVATPIITLTTSSAAVTPVAGVTFYYTVGKPNNVTPTAGSTLYTGAVTLEDGQEIKVIGVKNGELNSEVATTTYTASP